MNCFLSGWWWKNLKNCFYEWAGFVNCSPSSRWRKIQRISLNFLFYLLWVDRWSLSTSVYTCCKPALSDCSDMHIAFCMAGLSRLHLHTACGAPTDLPSNFHEEAGVWSSIIWHVSAMMLHGIRPYPSGSEEDMHCAVNFDPIYSGSFILHAGWRGGSLPDPALPVCS